MKWNKPESIEVRMDAEISSYQEENYDPAKDGPLFVESISADGTDLTSE